MLVTVRVDDKRDSVIDEELVDPKVAIDSIVRQFNSKQACAPHKKNGAGRMADRASPS